MSSNNISGEKYYNYSDVSLLENKIRERIYELAIKRKLIEENRNTLNKLDLEKHDLVRRAEKAERQLSEVNLHLEVAINAARVAEAERSSVREALVNQKAKLEVADKERELLQQSNWSLQKVVSDNKQELEDMKSKLTSQSHLLDLIKNKYSQYQAGHELFTGEIEKLDKSQISLLEKNLSIIEMTKKVISAFEVQKKELSKLRDENANINQQLISLSAQLGLSKEHKSQAAESEMETKCLAEWQQVQQDMQRTINDKENEITDLQTSLNTALSTAAKLQSRDTEMTNKIICLEEELKIFKAYKVDNAKEDKEIQTESNNISDLSTHDNDDDDGDL